MPSVFKANPNLESDLERGPEYLKGIAEAAGPAQDFAKGFAPVETGDYRDSIKIVVFPSAKQVFLSAFDWKANFIEFGTEDTPTFAPLRRGCRAAGLKFKPSK